MGIAITPVIIASDPAACNREVKRWPIMIDRAGFSVICGKDREIRSFHLRYLMVFKGYNINETFPANHFPEIIPDIGNPVFDHIRDAQDRDPKGHENDTNNSDE